jgi:hypothetical protein
VARLRDGAVADRILADLKRWGVSDDFVTRTADGSTPVIVERISLGSSKVPKHSFSWRCPHCGSQFPAFKLVLASVAEEVAAKPERPDAYFFDRATPGGILLAKAYARRGALVVFELSGIGNPVLFRQAWEVSHVVKYSHERLRELPEIEVEGIPRLQVETLGEAGLRYRRFSRVGRAERWFNLEAFPVRTIRDTAGSGDWCTAGFIDKAGQDGVAGFGNMSDHAVSEALRFGQALSAWNCNYEGPRGGMYAVDRPTFIEQVREILEGSSAERDRTYPISRQVESSQPETICATCVATDLPIGSTESA